MGSSRSPSHCSQLFPKHAAWRGQAVAPRARRACHGQDKHPANLPWKLMPGVTFVWGRRCLGLRAAPQELTLVGTCKTIKNCIRELCKHFPLICPETQGTYPTGPEGVCFARWPLGAQRSGRTRTFVIICPPSLAWNSLAPPHPFLLPLWLQIPLRATPRGSNELAAQGQVQPSSPDGRG